MSERTPRLTDSVLYVSHGSPIAPDGTQRYKPQPRAAIVVSVPEQLDAEQRIGLIVFNQNDNSAGFFFDGACPHSADPAVGGTWHWLDEAA